MITVCLCLLGLGSLGAAMIQHLWQLYLTVGVLMALGAGGVALSTGSTVIARWFEARRGLALGLAAGGMSAGQLIMFRWPPG